MGSFFDRLKFTQRVDRTLYVQRGIFQDLLFNGQWKSEHWRSGRHIDTYFTKNDICNVGKNDLLTTYFYTGTQIPANSWFVSLISQTGYTGLAPTDTMTSHPGWAEFTTYSQTARVAWGQGAPANQTITNPTAMIFDIGANGTIMGVFVVSNNTKGGTSGIIWATALYQSPVPVLVADQIRTTYTLSC